MLSSSALLLLFFFLACYCCWVLLVSLGKQLLFFAVVGLLAMFFDFGFFFPLFCFLVGFFFLAFVFGS